jgi:hypothetical protein
LADDCGGITRNIRETIRRKLPVGTGCRAYGPQQPIATVGGALLREPDVFTSCPAPTRTSVNEIYEGVAFD